MAKIGLLATRDLTVRNMEHILFRITSILAQEHHVDIIGVHSASERIRENLNIYPTQKTSGIWRGPVLRRVKETRDYIKAEKPDLVMTISSIGVNGLAVAIAGKMEKTPSIARITSDIFKVYKTRATFKGKLSLFVRNNILGRLAIILADKTVLLHAAQMPSLIKAGFKKEKFYVVPQPVTFPEIGEYQTVRNEARAELGITNDDYLVGSMMRLDANKKISLLEDTVAKTLSQSSDIHFALIGTGDRRTDLQNKFKNEPRVKLIDQMPRDDLAKFYCACDAIVHMSDSEGLSNVMIEALYFKTPVIATDSGAITRAIVSNIVKTSDDFAATLATRKAKLDPLPNLLDKVSNETAWLKLIKLTLQHQGE